MALFLYDKSSNAFTKKSIVCSVTSNLLSKAFLTFTELWFLCLSVKSAISNFNSYKKKKYYPREFVAKTDDKVILSYLNKITTNNYDTFILIML